MPTVETATCLVCGYSQMDPIELGTICPCCGTQYGLSDEEMTFSELRQRWINDKRAQWWSRYTPKPAGWSPVNQLRNIGYDCALADLQKINGPQTALQSDRLAAAKH